MTKVVKKNKYRTPKASRHRCYQIAVERLKDPTDKIIDGKTLLKFLAWKVADDVPRVQAEKIK